MTHKEELKKQLIELTKREMELIEKKYRIATKDIFDEIDRIHQRESASGVR